MKTFKPGRFSKQEPPNEPGVYRWRNKESGQIDYVGETSDLARRKQEHERSPQPISSQTHDFEWKPADGRSSSRTRREYERMAIERYQPPLNQRRGGGGRKA